MRLYVGNLSFKTTEDNLRDLFGEYGEVVDVALMIDRITGRSRGFAFVEMSEESAGHSAIEATNGMEYDGRPLTVNEARPREPRGSEKNRHGAPQRRNR